MTSSPSGGPQTFVRKYLETLPGVAASLTTAFIVFVASLSLKPVRDWLFPTLVQNYPVICSFKPRLDPSRNTLFVEAFFVNTSDDMLTRKQLDDFLSARSQSGQDSVVVLTYSKNSPGRISSARENASFNYHRGNLRVQLDGDNRVSIAIDRIDAWAILKAEIEISGRELLLAGQTDETASALAVPLDGVIQLQSEGCYQ